MLDQENTHSAGCSKIPKISRGRGRFEWEKTVKTGKVKYMSAHEAIKLSCGAKELSFPAKRNIHSSSKPSRIVPSMPSRTPIRTPIKPQALSPKSSQCFKANSSVRPEELLPPRPRNTQQQAVQTAKDSKGETFLQFLHQISHLLLLLGIRKTWHLVWHFRNIHTLFFLFAHLNVVR